VEVVLRTDYQEYGRGQGDKGWVSEAHANLLISFLLYPAFLSASQQFHLSRMAALSLCDLLEELGLLPEIKWPNDILLGGEKVAGILIELGIKGAELEYGIIGMGLNVNQRSFPAFPRPATSLALQPFAPQKGESGLQPPALASRLESFMFQRYAMLERAEFSPLEKSYLDRLYGKDHPMLFQSSEGSFQGIIRGVDEFGRLLLEQDGLLRAYGMQEILFLDQGI